MQTNVSFSRFEFKYLLNQKQRHELESDLRNFVDFDPYVEKVKGHRYFVRSLYFDDPFFTGYYDKIDGLKSRAKFRVRTYTQSPSPDVVQFLEIKGRVNQLVYKKRVQVKLDESRKIHKQLVDSAPIDEINKQFFYDYYRKRLKPVALIDYWRRPYYCRHVPDFRLTFDSDLVATNTERLTPALTDTRRRIKPGYTVLEIKFGRQVPAWFHRLIQSHQLHRQAFSKICHGLEELKLVEEL